MKDNAPKPRQTAGEFSAYSFLDRVFQVWGISPDANDEVLKFVREKAGQIK